MRKKGLGLRKAFASERCAQGGLRASSNDPGSGFCLGVYGLRLRAKGFLFLAASHAEADASLTPEVPNPKTKPPPPPPAPGTDKTTRVPMKGAGLRRSTVGSTVLVFFSHTFFFFLGGGGGGSEAKPWTPKP